MFGNSFAFAFAIAFDYCCHCCCGKVIEPATASCTCHFLKCPEKVQEQSAVWKLTFRTIIARC